MTAFVVIIVVLVAGIAYTIYNTIAARQQVEIVVHGREPEVLARVQGYFGRTWTRVGGPGDINVRPALRYQPATLSIDVAEQFGGQCRVSIWTSSWTNHAFLMGHAQLARRKKNGLAAALSHHEPARTDRPAAA